MNISLLSVYKKSIVSSDFFQEVTDIHTHILPGVDDGAKTEEEAIAMLISLNQMGMKNIYLTSHVMDVMSEDYRMVFEGKYQNLFRKAPKGMSIRLAAEYMLDSNFNAHLEKGLLTYANKCVLVETSYAAPPMDLEGLLYNINLEGYTPILAHPERYNYMDENFYRKLKRRGCLFQMNVLSLGGYYGKRAAEKTYKLWKKGSYDFIGSDIHNWERFKKGLSQVQVTRKERMNLQKLFENNNKLW